MTPTANTTPSEADTRANFIDPALALVGWNSSHIIREYYFTDGRKLAGNQRGTRCFVDYLLHSENQHLAIIEAKKQSAHPTQGLQQAIDYAKKLSVRFVYSSNGDKIYEFDLETGKGDYVDNYPGTDELLARYAGKTNIIGRELRNIPFHLETGMRPRYYQELSIHAATDAIGSGKDRALLTLATGTGKTFIAFQIVHKLFQARWNRQQPGTRRPRILFLADRNILADQAINTFNPYENDLIKIDGEEIRKRNGVVPTNAHIFFAIYQAIAERENIGGYYNEYPADFFDLIIIDECHRGAANNEGSWRAILEHFSSAVHVGLTATPKRTDNIDTYNYFGQPVYEYSLKDGINDGFLTPYRVTRIRTNLDELVLTGDDHIIKGESYQDVYETEDFDNKIVVDERTELVAKAILENINPLEKTIIFCTNQNHTLTMRDMINRHKTVADPYYCVRITSDEGKAGRDLLERFQDNDRDIPTILSLPAGVFLPYSGVKTNVLFFERSGGTTETWFYECEPEKKLTKNKPTKNKPLTDGHLAGFVEMYGKRSTTDHSWTVSVDELKKDYDLSAKNPDKQNDVEHLAPRKILELIQEKEAAVTDLLGQIDTLLVEK